MSMTPAQKAFHERELEKAALDGRLRTHAHEGRVYAPERKPGRRVMIRGVIYADMHAASKAIGRPAKSLRNWIYKAMNGAHYVDDGVTA